MSSLYAMTRLLALALSGVTAATVVAVPAVATARSPVPVRSGMYGYQEMLDPDMMMFKVRHRKVINPRFAITVTCHHNDGTDQDIQYGPTPSDPTRRARVPRDGSGSINWIQRRDGSLIPDAEVSVAYTFRRHRRTLASVEVRANYSEPDGSGGTWTSRCYGVRPFVLDRGPLR